MDEGREFVMTLHMLCRIVQENEKKEKTERKGRKLCSRSCNADFADEAARGMPIARSGASCYLNQTSGGVFGIMMNK